MSTRSSVDADFKTDPEWHLYHDVGEPGGPLYLEIAYKGGAIFVVEVPQKLIDAMQGCPRLAFPDDVETP